ncbi:MAG: HAD family phosphatase [Planctomycetes bacterium]|nr:HAD family phosphatase [Planctomycetota bacterium]
MLKAIVFDFDGVIVDSEPLHFRSFLRIAQGLGVTFSYEEYLEKYIGYDDRDAFRSMLGLPTGVEGREADRRRVAELVEKKADAFEAVVAEGIEPIPGVVEFVKRAAACGPIAIASGATRRDIDLILRRLDLSHMFGTMVTADMVARSKPDPASYAMAVTLLGAQSPGLAPADCLAIEDTAAGIESARGAGLFTIGVTTTGPASKLHRAHRVIEGFRGLTMDQVRQWVG